MKLLQSMVGQLLCCAFIILSIALGLGALPAGATSDSRGLNSVNNSPAFVAGEEQPLNFNGIDQDVAVGNPADLNITGPVTISAWVNPTSLPASADNTAAIVTKWTQSLSGNSFGLWLRNNGTSLQVVAGVNPVGAEETAIGGNIPLNSWTHVAMTYNPSNSLLIIYVNGTPVGTTVGTPGAIKTTETSVYIGSERDGAGQFFPGAISQVQIFNRALTSAEIFSITKATRPSLTATPTPTPTPTSTPILEVDGSGAITISKTSPREFAIDDITMVEVDPPYFEGEFFYQDKDARLNFTTGLITAVSITGNTATFSGSALSQGNFGKKITFTVTVTANQTPHTNDTFSITISTGYSASGNVISGRGITIAPQVQ